MDKIFIQGLQFDTIIGVLPDERVTPQPVRVDLQLDVDTREAARSRDLADTVDYARLADAVISHTKRAQALLLETLAAEIAELALACAGVTGVRVRIAKPTAVAAADAVGIEIYRTD